MNVSIVRVRPQDRAWVCEIARQGAAGDFLIVAGREVHPANLSGFIAIGPGGNRMGLITYQIEGSQCEVVTFNAFTRHSGIGTKLLDTVSSEAQKLGCSKIFLVTTNDNLDALRFYQRRGFVLAKIHLSSVADIRRRKPGIPEFGSYGIPIRDEIELEKTLTQPASQSPAGYVLPLHGV